MKLSEASKSYKTQHFVKIKTYYTEAPSNNIVCILQHCKNFLYESILHTRDISRIYWIQIKCICQLKTFYTVLSHYFLVNLHISTILRSFQNNLSFTFLQWKKSYLYPNTAWSSYISSFNFTILRYRTRANEFYGFTFCIDPKTF